MYNNTSQHGGCPSQFTTKHMSHIKTHVSLLCCILLKHSLFLKLVSATECNAKLHEGYCNVKWYWMPAAWRCITSKWIWLPLMAPLIQIWGAVVDRKTIWMLWRMTHLSFTAAVPHSCRLFFRHKKTKVQLQADLCCCHKCLSSAFANRLFGAVAKKISCRFL